MSNPSNNIRDRWNAAHYAQVKVSVKPDLAADFKAACAANGVSIASVLSGFMAKYTKTAPKPKADPYGNRRRRRKLVAGIIAQMEQLIVAEETYKDSVPENLQGAKWHEAAEHSLAVMQEIIDLLHDIY